MESLKILQIGDIHYPEKKDEVIGDIKDKSAPNSLINATTVHRIQRIIREIHRTTENSTISGIMICGDLTSYGDINGYNECIDYLNNSLEICDDRKWPDDSLHIVPGNHDIDHNNCDPDDKDLFKKFQPLVESWQVHGRDSIITTKSLRSSVVNKNNHTINIFSLNSCIGSGEKRHLPKKIRDQFESILTSYSKSASSTDSFELIYEQLDTPTVHNDHVIELVNGIKAIGIKSLPIVLAHHNVLPQTIPRWEIYTELVNSGQFRSSLASCLRPIIYCHGHIHDDSIEELIDHHNISSKIIFISAPLLTDGFNVLEVQFARNEIPLGCIVHKYRLNNKGQLSYENTIRIPLVSNDMMPEFRDEYISSLIKACNSGEERFQILRDSIGMDIGTRPNISTLEKVLLEAEWLNLIKITDRSCSSKHWKIRRVQP